MSNSNLSLTHEDYDEAQKLMNVARENDKDFRAIDNIWNNWIKYALRCKQFTTNRVHVLHIAGIIQQHCYKRFDLAERFFEMALLRSDKNLNQDIFLYNCVHNGDDENESRVRTSLKFLLGDFTRDLIVDKGLNIGGDRFCFVSGLLLLVSIDFFFFGVVGSLFNLR